MPLLAGIVAVKRPPLGAGHLAPFGITLNTMG